MTTIETPIDGLYNFRDIGGMPLTAGGSTRHGVLYRSDALGALTPRGIAEFAATDIDVIIDFRTPEEQHAAPDRLPTSRGFRVIALSILEGAMSDLAQKFIQAGTAPTPELVAQLLAAVPALGDLYVGMLQHGASAFVEVARQIAAPNTEPSAVLVHCTAGKDRTGVATALMLDAIGVQRATIVADYARSQDNLAGPWADGMLSTVASFGLPITPALRTLATGTPPEAIERALAWTDAEHGGAAGYLVSGGLTDAELARLRSRLTA